MNWLKKFRKMLERPNISKRNVRLRRKGISNLQKDKLAVKAKMH